MKNRIHINREYWPEVTTMPHFIVDIGYEGCRLSYDDIYFDKVEEAIPLLQKLERERRGAVTLDGGHRFKLTAEAASTGGMRLKFAASSSGAFPGRLELEGYFMIDGEYTAAVLGALIALLRDGKEFTID